MWAFPRLLLKHCIQTPITMRHIQKCCTSPTPFVFLWSEFASFYIVYLLPIFSFLFYIKVKHNLCSVASFCICLYHYS